MKNRNIEFVLNALTEKLNNNGDIVKYNSLAKLRATLEAAEKEERKRKQWS